MTKTSKDKTTRNLIGLIRRLNGDQLPSDYTFSMTVKSGVFTEAFLADLNKD